MLAAGTEGRVGDVDEDKLGHVANFSEVAYQTTANKRLFRALHP